MALSLLLDSLIWPSRPETANCPNSLSRNIELSRVGAFCALSHRFHSFLAGGSVPFSRWRCLLPSHSGKTAMTSTTTHNVHKFYRVARAAKARAGPRSFFRQLLDNWLSQGA